ncbi:hypothetical protein B0T10DRAFT_488155 [Thelonectria olida]|uniref:Uncharacterized protein n=1 Tax=Thelonectria olida TaxID=1576542 RepID=A0A9P8W254_9HYPO|nr:hypothetical protein B0T10DRAFT_488155 [Thelonectria olida]
MKKCVLSRYPHLLSHTQTHTYNMHFFHKLTPFLAAAAALEVQLVWRLEKDSGKTSLSAYSSAKGSLVAETCGSTLKADSDIDFSDVNEDGSGNFTVGDDSYRVHAKAKFSGGPACSKTFNQEFALVQCSGVEWTAKNAVQGNATHCFENDYSSRALESIQRRGQTHEMHSRGLDERQYCTWYTTTSLVGDGNPHQNFLHKQLSETIACGTADSCSVGSMNSRSFTIGWSADASAAGWISGGFSVTETWTTGNTYTCTAGEGETICIWYNTAHTAYTVQNYDRNVCGTSNTNGGPYVMYSPNDKNSGGGYYCVIGTCRSQGDQYWDKTGRAGGP